MLLVPSGDPGMFISKVHALRTFQELSLPSTATGGPPMPRGEVTVGWFIGAIALDFLQSISIGLGRFSQFVFADEKNLVCHKKIHNIFEI